MPFLPRQLGVESLLSQALQSRISTASVAILGPSTPVVAPTPTLSTLPSVSTVSVIVVETTPLATPTPSAAPLTSVVSQTPTVSVIVFTTTTTPPLIPTTQAVTSSSAIVSSSSIPPPVSTPLVLTTPAVSIPEVSNVPTTSRSVTSASASASGVAANAGNSAQPGSSSGISNGIIALIVVGVLLVALLAGAFTFRRVQVYRRTKRRQNNYGAGAIPDTAPFPFTNVSETDLKGAEPVTRDFRQGSVPSMNEKPLPIIAPMQQYGDTATFAQPGSMMTGPYPTMGAAASYGYSSNERTASPAPSQAPRIMSPAPPPVAFMRTASPAPSVSVAPGQYLQAPTFAPKALAPVDGLAPHLRGRKRVVQTFQPTLPDELDIRDGDWVTIVHAYDDGWGLCERNGRRGVVPLECLDLGKSEVRASRRLSSLSAIRS